MLKKQTVLLLCSLKAELDSITERSALIAHFKDGAKIGPNVPLRMFYADEKNPALDRANIHEFNRSGVKFISDLESAKLIIIILPSVRNPFLLERR